MNTKALIVAILVISMLSCYSGNIFAQVEFETDERKMVGFGCFYEGRETKVVTRFGKMLTQHRYESVIRMLQSKNTAERFMAVICVERLVAAGRITIDADEKALIEEIRTSEESVALCSGCLPYPDIPIKDAFDSEILWRKTAWLDGHIKD
jgi:hypothetical protein